MKIRKKITFWISGAALLPTIVFSSFIFWEMMKQPFTLIDRELGHMANALIEQMAAAAPITGRFIPADMPYDPDLYWIMAKDDKGRIIYRSRLTAYTDLAVAGKKSRYLVEKNIPKSRIWLGQDPMDDVMFRAMFIHSKIDGRPITIRIAKPIEGLEEELISLALDIGISLLFCVLAIFFLSYALAGRILNPIAAITRKAREISEKSLDKRISLRKTRDELYELSISLNHMFDRIQHSFNRQKEFIGNASHELKSPITRLMLAQEEMLMNEILSPSSQASLIKQLETTRLMGHMVKNLLDLSRMEQQETVNKETVDLAELLTRILDDYGDVLSGKQINVQNEVAGPCPVTGDPEKLFRLLVNLIDNAIRYNLKDRGRIQIKAEKQKNRICLKIYNSGSHIPEADLPRLFDQFYRVEKSRSRVLGGSGLGLAIAQKIVLLHNGTIQITNAPDQMIKVIVCLPQDL